MKATILITLITVIAISCNDGEGNKKTLFPKGNKSPAFNFTVWLHPVVANDSTFNL